MPTKTELEDLFNVSKCTHTWKTAIPWSGYEFKGLAGTPYENNSVFFPATGFYDRDHNCIDKGDIFGYYWSSTPHGRYNAFCLAFGSDNQNMTYKGRSEGYPVRAVLAE